MDCIGECLPDTLKKGQCYKDEEGTHYWYFGRTLNYGGLPMFECFEYLSEEEDLGDGNMGYLIFRHRMVENLTRCSKHDKKPFKEPIGKVVYND